VIGHASGLDLQNAGRSEQNLEAASRFYLCDSGMFCPKRSAGMDSHLRKPSDPAARPRQEISERNAAGFRGLLQFWGLTDPLRSELIDDDDFPDTVLDDEEG
jgi:hypothetical protein